MQSDSSENDEAPLISSRERSQEPPSDGNDNLSKSSSHARGRRPRSRSRGRTAPRSGSVGAAARAKAGGSGDLDHHRQSQHDRSHMNSKKNEGETNNNDPLSNFESLMSTHDAKVASKQQQQQEKQQQQQNSVRDNKELRSSSHGNSNSGRPSMNIKRQSSMRVLSRHHSGNQGIAGRGGGGRNKRDLMMKKSMSDRHLFGGAPERRRAEERASAVADFRKKAPPRQHSGKPSAATRSNVASSDEEDGVTHNTKKHSGKGVNPQQLQQRHNHHHHHRHHGHNDHDKEGGGAKAPRRMSGRGITHDDKEGGEKSPRRMSGRTTSSGEGLAAGSSHGRPRPPRRQHSSNDDNSTSSMSVGSHDDSKKENQLRSNTAAASSSSSRVEELESQVALYKEQYKRAMREKKQLSSKLAAETSIKDTMNEQLYQEIQKLRDENAKLKASAGNDQNNKNNKSNQLTEDTKSGPMPPATPSCLSCDVWPGTGMLLTSWHRPRPSVFYLPGLRSLPVWTQQTGVNTSVAYHDAPLTWAVNLLEEKHGEIADEYQRVAPFVLSDYNATQEAAQAAGEESWVMKPTPEDDEENEEGGTTPSKNPNWDWHSYTLEGKINPVFEQNFAKTSEILQSVRQKNLLFDKLPFAHTYFSTLHAQCKLLPHSSPMNLRLRLLLPLMVPSDEDDEDDEEEVEDPRPQSGLRVGPTTRAWELGRAMLIDDTYDHEQWNEQDSDLAVLVVDLWHPDVTLKERKELQSIFE